LHEAGVKLDVCAGCGVGVVGAMFSAIDAASRTWEDGGIWKRKSSVRLYQWRPALQTALALVLGAVVVLAVPLLAVASGLIAYPFSFLVQMVSADAGRRIAAGYTAWIDAIFAPWALPTLIPRLVTLAILCAVAVVTGAALRSSEKRRWEPGHRAQPQWWSRLVDAPWSAEPALRHYRDALWQIFRGRANAPPPSATDLSRRYVDLLIENFGQPGFRELIVTTLDLDTRRDLVFAALREEWRPGFFHRDGEEPVLQGDLIDLAGIGRAQALDALAAALSLPPLTRPHVIAFSPESYWKGEAHRTCCRPAGVARLLHELSVAGVEQVIIVSADADRAAPHQLARPAGSLQARIGEQLMAAEACSVRDAIKAANGIFHGIFLVEPTHNPVGPFDFEGAFDVSSDRFQTIGELVDRGYEDAYRQFIEPVVGA